MTRRSGSAIVWSPPIDNSCDAPESTSSAPDSIWAIASWMSNGLHAMSPASATCCSANGRTSSPGW